MVLGPWWRKNWLRVVVHAAAWVPLVWLAAHYAQGAFLVDPVREMTTFTGKTALILLVLSLACTPISTVTGLKMVVRVRRALGLYALLYASVHFAIFVGLDYGFDLGLLREAIFEQRFVIVGFAAGVILLLLGITSTRGWQRRLRRNWKRLHRLVYVAAVLAVAHFLWLTKDPQEPLRYAALVAGLLLLRLPPVRRAASRLRRRLASRLERKERREPEAVTAPR
jgi:methionine sulfoxide reductase heme-binding subunit